MRRRSPRAIHRISLASVPDLATLDATAQAALVRSGEVGPRELVDAALERIEALDPALNAVVHRLDAKAREAASGELPPGPFRGVPFLLKDLLCHSAGDPYHAGMRFLRELGWTTPDDTTLAARYRSAGFVFVGRTNTPELGGKPTTEPAAYGPTRNPWCLDRSTGGSSGGSAAAVAAGLVPAAHANDGGGSIRIPASACGLVGLRPTRGRTSLGPDAGEVWGGLVVEHVVTRSVRDSAGILDAVHGPAPGDPYSIPGPARPYLDEVGADPGSLRIGWTGQLPEGTATVHPTCAAAARAAAEHLADLGHRVEEACPEGLDDPDVTRAMGTLVATWTARDLDAWSERTKRRIGEADVEPTTWLMATLGRALGATDYVRDVEVLQAHGRRMARWWSGEAPFDLLLTPTLAAPPPRLGELDPDPEDVMLGLGRSHPFGVFTMPFNITGQPAVSLPLHWDDEGLPIGVQLAAALGREDLLFRVAAQLERAVPWRDRWPPHSWPRRRGEAHGPDTTGAGAPPRRETT